VFRTLFGHKRDEVKREWRKLHNVELNDPYSSQNIIRVIKKNATRTGGRGIYRVLMGKPEGKRPLERPKCR
jgi:hypothetical protein